MDYIALATVARRLMPRLDWKRRRKTVRRIKRRTKKTKRTRRRMDRR